MRRHANTWVAIGAALLIGGSAFAQQDQPQKPPVTTQEQKPAVTQEKSPMSMGDMMKGCRDHCEQTSASIDRVMQTMDEAKQSNDEHDAEDAQYGQPEVGRRPTAQGGHMQ